MAHLDTGVVAGTQRHSLTLLCTTLTGRTVYSFLQSVGVGPTEQLVDLVDTTHLFLCGAHFLHDVLAIHYKVAVVRNFFSRLFIALCLILLSKGHHCKKKKKLIGLTIDSLSISA